jgi:hypothetical protein
VTALSLVALIHNLLSIIGIISPLRTGAPEVNVIGNDIILLLLTSNFSLLQAISNKDQHSISYTLSRAQTVVVEYTHDSNTDMFQVSVSPACPHCSSQAWSQICCAVLPTHMVDCVITLAVADVSKTFEQVNIHKAAEPDGLPGSIPRACADQLASVFTDIFNLSQTLSVTPTCFKQTIIVAVPKNAKVTCLNDYHTVTVTVTPVDMKCSKRLAFIG